MAKGTSIEADERAELLALYQVTAQDLAFFKSQQWSLANYCLIALAALAGVTQLSTVTVTACVGVLLCLLAATLTGLCAWLLKRLDGSIEERRGRLERVYARLSTEFRIARGVKASVSAWETVISLWVILALALALAIWVIISATV
jgi:hypothetical protein